MRAGQHIVQHVSSIAAIGGFELGYLTMSSIKIADVQVAQAQLGGALASYRESEKIRRCLARADPDNSEWQRDSFFILTKIAEMLDQHGQRAVAMQIAEERRANDERLASVRSANGVS